MNNKIKMRRSGQIWYYDNCAYLEDITFNTIIDNYDCFYDILYWLRDKEGFEVEYDQNCYLNNGETTYIQFSEGKKIAINNETKKEIYIVALIDIAEAKSFDYFDNVIEFERFYKRVKDKLAEFIKIKEEEINR